MTDNPSLFTDPLALSGRRFAHGLARLSDIPISEKFVPSQSLSVYIDKKGRVNVNGPIRLYEVTDPIDSVEVPSFSPDNKFIKGLEKAIDAVPVGTVLLYGNGDLNINSVTLPSGYVKCDGKIYKLPNGRFWTTPDFSLLTTLSIVYIQKIPADAERF
jgi:hypothetical protein